MKTFAEEIWSGLIMPHWRSIVFGESEKQHLQETSLRDRRSKYKFLGTRGQKFLESP